MKPQELRVGILVNCDNEYSAIDGIRKDFNDEPYLVELKFNDGLFSEVGIERIKPIPLTEQWLLRCGIYEEYYRGIVVELNLLSGRKARFIFQKSGYLILHDDRKNIVIGKLEFVHQLQNLYFALTGKELCLTSLETSK